MTWFDEALEALGKVVGFGFLGLIGLVFLGNLYATFKAEGFITFGLWMVSLGLPFWGFYRWTNCFCSNQIGRSLLSGILTVILIMIVAIGLQALS